MEWLIFIKTQIRSNKILLAEISGESKTKYRVTTDTDGWTLNKHIYYK